MATDLVNSREGAAAQWPDAQGRFGRFGGKYAPETLMPALDELEEILKAAQQPPPDLDLTALALTDETVLTPSLW